MKVFACGRYGRFGGRGGYSFGSAFVLFRWWGSGIGSRAYAEHGEIDVVAPVASDPAGVDSGSKGIAVVGVDT